MTIYCFTFDMWIFKIVWMETFFEMWIWEIRFWW